jgi:hypothetical protein
MASGGDDTAFGATSGAAPGVDGAASGVYVVGEQAVFAGLQDGEGVIVDTRSAFYFGLNKTAAFLWEKLQKEKEVTAAQLTDALCARFEVTRPKAAEDVESFLRHVVEYGLAKRRENAVNE